VLPKLNRAATIPIAEHAQFKADARAFVSLIQDYFLEASIWPKLHMLFAHSWQFMGTWGSTGLYGEQAISHGTVFLTSTRPGLQQRRPYSRAGSWCRRWH